MRDKFGIPEGSSTKRLGMLFESVLEYIINMFVPITSEVTITTGMVLKEIATDRLFEIGHRLSGKEEVWGDDSWELTEIGSGNPARTAIALPYQDLAMKYLAEVED
jgi:hypothetical protein